MGHWVQVLSANIGITYTGGWCLKGTQDAFGTPHMYATADDDWYSGEDAAHDTALGNHDGEVPPQGVQVPVYLALGNVPAGDVAISLGDGRVAACALPGTHVGMYIYGSLQAYINDYGKYNGGATYLGWSEGTANTRVVAWQPDITTSDATQTDVIPYEEQTQDNPNSPIGQDQTLQVGIDGSHTVVTRTTYSDGNVTNTEVISDTTIPATPHIIAKGSGPAVPPVEPQPPTAGGDTGTTTPPVVTPPVDPPVIVPPIVTPVPWWVLLWKIILGFFKEIK